MSDFADKMCNFWKGEKPLSLFGETLQRVKFKNESLELKDYKFTPLPKLHLSLCVQLVLCQHAPLISQMLALFVINILYLFVNVDNC